MNWNTTATIGKMNSDDGGCPPIAAVRIAATAGSLYLNGMRSVGKCIIKKQNNGISVLLS